MECTLPDHSMKRRHSVISTPTRMMAALPGATTALESCDGSGGDEDLQLWTLVNLSKMTESSSMICSREGLDDAEDAASFGSQMRALRAAWRYVWNALRELQARR